MKHFMHWCSDFCQEFPGKVGKYQTIKWHSCYGSVMIFFFGGVVVISLYYQHNLLSVP